MNPLSRVPRRVLSDWCERPRGAVSPGVPGDRSVDVTAAGHQRAAATAADGGQRRLPLGRRADVSCCERGARVTGRRVRSVSRSGFSVQTPAADTARSNHCRRAASAEHRRQRPGPVRPVPHRDHGIGPEPIGLRGLVLDPRAGLHTAVLAAARARGAKTAVMVLPQNTAANVAACGHPFLRHDHARLLYGHSLYERIPVLASGHRRHRFIPRAGTFRREVSPAGQTQPVQGSGQSWGVPAGGSASTRRRRGVRRRVCPRHPEVDWEQLRTAGKGRRGAVHGDAAANGRFKAAPAAVRGVDAGLVPGLAAPASAVTATPRSVRTPTSPSRSRRTPAPATGSWPWAGKPPSPSNARRALPYVTLGPCRIGRVLQAALVLHNSSWE